MSPSEVVVKNYILEKYTREWETEFLHQIFDYRFLRCVLCEILMFPRLFPFTPDDEFCDYIICCFLLIVIMLYICKDGTMNMKLLCEIVYL